MPDNDLSLSRLRAIAEALQPEQSLLQKLGETWPARAAQGLWGAATLPGDVYQGNVSMYGADGRTNPDVIGRSTDLAGLAMTGTLGAPAGAMGSGFVRRPVREAAEDVAKQFREIGYDVGDITHWGGQAGNSSYFRPSYKNAFGDIMSLPEVRVSDHSVGPRRMQEHFALLDADNLDTAKIMARAKELATQHADAGTRRQAIVDGITGNETLRSEVLSAGRDSGKAWAAYKRSGLPGTYDDFMRVMTALKRGGDFL